MTFEPKERQALIVWLYSLKYFNKLKNYGLIHYVSKKMKYVVMYVDQDQVETCKSNLEELHFVRSVEESPKKEIPLEFSQVLPDLREERAAKKRQAKSQENFEESIDF